MSRRIIAIITSAVLAILAGLLVYNYVQHADARAIAELSPEKVVVVTEQIPAGTPAAELADYVAVEEHPGTTIAADAIESIDEVAGLITESELYPGEQVLRTRFISADEETAVQVPDDHHEITIQLPAARVIGGYVSAGDTVGLFVSSEDETRQLLHKVLVTHVEGGAVPENPDDPDSGASAAESLLVTLAVAPADAPLVVNAAEFHGVWLSLEPADAPERSTTVDREDLFG